MTWTDPGAHVWTTGEVVTASSLNTYVRANLQALYDSPFCVAYTSVALSIPNIAVTAVVLNTERQDNDEIHSVSVLASRFIPPTAGGYAMSGVLAWAGAAGGTQRTGLIRLNGVTTIAQDDPPPNGAAATGVTVGRIYRLVVGDYVELCGYQNSGGAVNVTAEFAIARVSNG